jgi:hypothetical protein
LPGRAKRYTPPEPMPHPYATSYTRVAIPAWDCVSAAGDAAATLAAMQGRQRHLIDDPTWGWLGRIRLPSAVCRLPSPDPAFPLALAVARRPWAALADLTSPLAVGLGSSKGDPTHLPLAGQDWIDSWPGALSLRLAAALGIRQSIPCATAAACSTGLTSLLAAADWIEHDIAAGALVGAAESSLTPLILAGFANAGALCGHTPPQAFAATTGFAPAEGAGAFALRRADPAAAGWRLIAGVRLGDAGHATQFTDPATLRTALAALWDLCPQPDAIICHATGTAVGDPYEAAALNAGPWRDLPRWCWKPWIGHALGASGALELAAALEAPAGRLWKLSLGFGGHLAAVAVERR